SAWNDRPQPVRAWRACRRRRPAGLTGRAGPSMRVTLHDYATDPSLPQKDGVNLAHENIAALLKERGDRGLDVRFHDFTRLLADEDYARRVLSAADCVVSNVGPHAHYYFWLRERLGLDFRILRDV